MALKVLPGPLFAERTTLRLGGRARAELRLESAEDCHALADELARQDGRPMALGWGSNLLALDGDLPLVALSLAAAEPELVGVEEDGFQRVKACGGLMLPKLISWAAARGLSGLEGLAGIPGTVGGAVAMNAGSYGRQTAELLARVRLWTPEVGLTWIGPESWIAGYRRFEPVFVAGARDAAGAQGSDGSSARSVSLKAGASGAVWLVAEAELILDVADAERVQAGVRAVLSKKKASQPVSAATCGCVFKNPLGGSAGKMLDECGFKGRRLGGMAFSEMHANFLVNQGGGTADAALELIALAREAVTNRFGVNLELEVQVIQ